MKPLVWVIFLWIARAESTEITSQVFGTDTDVLPAAFGDFNSDELTDLFVTRNDGKIVQVLLGSNEADGPLLKSSELKCIFECSVTSVIPGDLNGDALMDVLVTTACITGQSKGHQETLNVHVLWGGRRGDESILNCSHDESRPILKTRGQPLAIDYNNDFIIDLFGVDEDRRRKFWLFSPEGTPSAINMTGQHGADSNRIREPHSNAYLDLNGDYAADLFVTTTTRNGGYEFEIWYGENGGNHETKFKLEKIMNPPERAKIIGQSVFLDLELKGKIDHILPVFNGSKWSVHVCSNNEWHDLKVNLQDDKGGVWNFFSDERLPFSRAVTLRGGDYNMDGYPDLLATLTDGISNRTFLLENKPCKTCENFSRTFVVRWNGFSPTVNDSALGVFYDIFQDGILDVILVRKYLNGSYCVAAYKNNLDYDANFVKVMVLTGLANNNKPSRSGSLGKLKRSFGTNYPGPRISYKTIDQDGNTRTGSSAQIPQSAYHSLNLPYTMFALGRTPNFVDNITVGFASFYRDWPQVIPNSQMVVIPDPIDNPNKWKVQLFVTPSKVILMSGVALAATCIFISVIIGVLHWEERKIDRLERLQEAYRFHFDAM